METKQLSMTKSLTMALTREVFIKKLIYQSNNRGCKETDMILGNFSKMHLAQMSDEELKDYAHLLDQTDADIWDWFNRSTIPKEASLQKIMKRIEAAL